MGYNKNPTVYLLDIETSPIVGLAWQAFDTNLLKILEPSKIISVSWKELNSKEITVKALPDYKGYKKNIVDDQALIKEVWGVLDKADIIIGHHLDSFDIRKLNSRFVVHGLNAPSAYQTVDTCKIAKRYFKFDSNSLNNLGVFLGVGEKLGHGGFSMWEQCMAGDLEAWKIMKAYNAQDVLLLEKVYLALRPFERRHPDLNIITGNGKDKPTCGTCLSINVQKRGFSLTRTGKKQRYQCSDCGSWSTGIFEKNKVVEEEMESVD